ncbi:LysE family translocator [Streptomyces sp. BE20]|uniref:LysE family translocator n=1 Tax=Streptomyces sp. BE20 TaxID=3002525 RepID=UPI002E771AB4|nr:LysE family translocator [Streptomyces sp. BE20]MEE1825305.1 LysE family translocator [Streptomyces sp. BE20]
MLDLPLYLAFVTAALALCVTPGPDMLFVVAMGGRGGPAAGVMAALGVAFGATVHALAAMLGLSSLFAHLPALYDVLRWAGAAYLVLLAVQAFRDRSPLGADGGDDGAPVPGRLRAFSKGTVTNLLNPKVIMFNIAFLPQFVSPGLGHVTGQLLLLGLTMVAVGLAVDITVGVLSGRLAALLRRSTRVARGLNVLSGAVFGALAVRLVTAPE